MARTSLAADTKEALGKWKSDLYIEVVLVFVALVGPSHFVIS